MELYFFLWLSCSLIIKSIFALEKDSKDDIKSVKLPPCAACKALTQSFSKGMERTERGKFEGGDSAWEEEKMKSYKKSEVRLVEIQEKLCMEIERGQNQCLAHAEEHEDLLEDWWFKKQEENADLYTWLCIKMLEVCCPWNHYGPSCHPCRGGDNPCNGNGKCKGNGTRKGNGECECNKGYKGDDCDTCLVGFYQSYKDDSKILCDACHKSCQGSCQGPGAKSCLSCNQGWTFEASKGCLDVNECLKLKEPCDENNEFCVNSEGSYSCLKCDKSCHGCDGDGSDMCLKCAEGYSMKDGFCDDDSDKKREDGLVFARYVTYGGLTIATCIIFQKHTTLAAVVGLVVASYISFSEYYLTHVMTKNPPSAPQF